MPTFGINIQDDQWRCECGRWHKFNTIQCYITRAIKPVRPYYYAQWREAKACHSDYWQIVDGRKVYPSLRRWPIGNNDAE